MSHPAQQTGRPSFYRRYGKRLLDLVLTIPAVVLLAPLLGLLAVAVRLKLGSPILFRQARPGRNGRPFLLTKFRTMRDERDAAGELLSDAERLTGLGKWMRKWSLDELPELFQVLTGEMSLVGPRPLLMQYLPLYSPEQARRHQVQPGITGWAQVNGRNAVDWPQRFKLDGYYVDHQSFNLDCRILLTTLVKVCRREGINQEGQATREGFKGNAHAG